MHTLFVGSSNQKKLSELSEALAGLPVRLLTPREWPTPLPIPAENEITFFGNARAKALAYANATGELTLADDSGLEVQALDGAPGVHSARFAGPPAADVDNNPLLLERPRHVPLERRLARFVCCLVVARGSEILISAEGTCEGVISHLPRGASGFGYDPLFHLPELGKSFAELDSKEKLERSHRGRALRALRPRLEALLLTRSVP